MTDARVRSEPEVPGKSVHHPLRANAHLTYGFGPKASATGYVNLAFEKNDDLNLYDFERDVLTPGITLFLVPDDMLVLTGGASYSRVKSNAKLCATVMDG